MLRSYLRLAVVGDPVAHSKSPSLHAGFLREAGIAGSYEALRVTAEEAPEALERLFAAGYVGLNVTTPLKEIVLGSACDADPIVRVVAAANTLIAAPAGWHAANTDGVGAFCSLYAALTGETLAPHDAPDRVLAARVLVAGTGPTARAAAYVCAEQGMDVALAGRDPARVRMLCGALGARAWTPGAAVDAVFSTLPPDATLAPELRDAARDARIVIDANYGERSTLAAILNRPIIDGSAMLAAQARASFERWR